MSVAHCGCTSFCKKIITKAVLTIEQWGLDINALINVFFHLGLLKVSRGEELTIMQKDLGSGWTSVRNSEEQVIIEK